MNYPTIKLRGKLSDLGQVKLDKVSDGIEEFDCHYVEIAPNVRFCQINGKYYIDREFEIRRVNEELIQKYNLKEYVYVYRPLEEPKEEPTVAKEEPVAPPKKRGRPKKV